MVQRFGRFDIPGADDAIRFCPLPVRGSEPVLHRRCGRWEHTQAHIFVEETAEALKQSTIEVLVIVLQRANQRGKLDSKMNGSFGEAVDECTHPVEFSVVKYEDPDAEPLGRINVFEYLRGG